MTSSKWQLAAVLIVASTVVGVLGWQRFAPRPVPPTTITVASTVTVFPSTSVTMATSITVSTLDERLLLPGQIVRHSPTDTNPYAFYSYFPWSASKNRELVLCVWPHGGGMPSQNYSDHEKRASDHLGWLKRYAEQYKLPIVVVAIPRVEHLYVHSLHPGTFTSKDEMLRRPDLKLIDAVWSQYIPLMRKAGLRVDERVHMMGFSSVGMFAHRFTMLHPTRVKAVWLGGEAPAPLPATELDGQPLNYPLGMRDIKDLGGEPFDFETYRRIRHFICVGENDVNPNNDTTTYTDIFTEQQRLFIRSRFGATNPERIRFFYDYLSSVGVPAEFRLYQGIGHTITDQMMHDAFNFLTTRS